MKAGCLSELCVARPSKSPYAIALLVSTLHLFGPIDWITGVQVYELARDCRPTANEAGSDATKWTPIGAVEKRKRARLNCAACSRHWFVVKLGVTVVRHRCD